MEEESDDKDDTKRKSRNLSEKKRRDQFNSLVNDLSALITPSNRKMDKSTVLKSTITFLKHHNEAADRSKVFEIESNWKPPFLTNHEFTHLMLEAIDGFMLVFSSTGAIYYASDNITSLLGYLPSDILKMTVFDLSHAMSHESICNIFLNPPPAIEPFQTGVTPSNSVTFHAHVKRESFDRLGFNAYELVKFVGYLRHAVNADNVPSTHSPQDQSQNSEGAGSERKLIFVGTGRIVMPQLIREMSAVDTALNEFTSKHSLEWKFLFLDNRAPPIIGYLPFEVLGTSGYDYYHFDDLDDIVSDHEELMQKGEGKSCFYRFLTKGQQWIWLQTSFYVSYHQHSSKPDYVVCTHNVFSNADIIRQGKVGGKSKKTLDPYISKSKASTLTLKDVENTHSNTGSALVQPLSMDCGSSTIPSGLLGFEQTKEWANLTTSASVTPSTRSLKTSHPPCGYENPASEDAPPSAKRKRYSRQNCGNESDSTSVSGDSKASRYSLLTHLSSHIRQRRSMSQTHHPPPQVNGQQEQQQISNHLQQQQPSLHQSQAHPQAHPQAQPHLQSQPLQMGPAVLQNRRLPLLQHHSVASGPIITDSSCQFTTRPFPFQHPPAPIVAPAFLESSPFLAAIPVQPVIAPFPLSPVQIPTLPPISLGLPNVAVNQNPVLQSQSCVRHEVDLEPASGFVMTPNQSQLQDQLQLKHDELQKLIMQQQDELRMVSEQLLLSRYSMQQSPLIPVSYNNASGGSARSIHCVSNASQQHGFNQYGFPMGAAGQPHQFEQLQQQQNQHQHIITTQQQQQLQAIPPHDQQQQQQQVSLLQNTQQAANQQQHREQEQQHQNQQQQQQPNLLPRNVADLEQFGDEEIDAFLNLSPLQSLVSLQTALNQSSDQPGNISNNNNNKNNSHHSNNKSSGTHQTPQQQHNEDPLLSYMQMSTEPSLGINFQMGLSDDGSETPSEDTKLLYNHLELQPHQQHSDAYFPADPLQSVSQPASVSSSHMPNDLDILPYNVLREESENLLNPSHIPPDV